MKITITQQLIFVICLSFGMLDVIWAVTDAELDALEKELEQQEIEKIEKSKEQKKNEQIKIDEAKHLEEEKKLLEEERKKLAEEKKKIDERAKRVELERKQIEEEKNKKNMQSISKISVLSGTYGANCGAPIGNVTQHLVNSCNERQRCEYIIDYKVIGDPVWGCGKTYVAEWKCSQNGKILRVEVPPEAGYQKKAILFCAETLDK